jgi:hypothetical protein
MIIILQGIGMVRKKWNSQMIEPNRRQFLGGSIACAAGLCCPNLPATPIRPSTFATRGVVLVPEDLTMPDWPKRAKHAGLTTIGIHHQNSPKAVILWIRSDAGQRFLAQCRSLGLEVEYELHAMKELLPRDLFEKNPEWFRMNDRGERSPDANCCVHAERGLEIIGKNAMEIGKLLRPTTGRYFYWGDDGQPWCSCPKCCDLSPAEQSLLVEARILKALRGPDPKAQVAHLAYANSLRPPKQIKPPEGVFLEYAPIQRRYDIPYSRQQGPNQRDGLDALDANLEVFRAETAQVLEYWLDVSRFSTWRRPAVKLPWNKGVFLADVEAYRKRGIRHVTTFAVWIDAAYKKRFGNLNFLDDYGSGLSGR